MKPSQKGRACQASYQPAHLTEPPSESIILITRLTSALINSHCKHKRLMPRQKKSIFLSCAKMYTIGKTPCFQNL